MDVMNRKEFLRLLTAAMVTTTLTACDNRSTKPQPTETAAASESFSANAAPVQLPEGIEGLRQGYGTLGYAGRNGFYHCRHRRDGSTNLCCVDVEAGVERIVCNHPGCKHNNADCPAWTPLEPATPLVIPIGDQLVLLHTGKSSLFPTLGDLALAYLEQMGADGANRRVVHTFRPGETILASPEDGFARDASHLYFVLESEEAQIRTLCELDTETEIVQEIYRFTEEKEQIVGGEDRQLLLSYVSHRNAKTPMVQLIRLDLDSGKATSFLEHSCQDYGVCAEGAYLLLSRKDQMIYQYGICTGEQWSSVPVEASELLDWDNILFVEYAQKQLLVISRNYNAIDIPDGRTYALHHFYTADNWGGQFPCRIVAETQNKFLMVCGSRVVKTQALDKQGETFESTCPELQYSLIRMEDFLDNVSNGIPIVDA